MSTNFNHTKTRKTLKPVRQVGSDEFHIPFDKHSTTEASGLLIKYPASHDSSKTVPDTWISLIVVRVSTLRPVIEVMSGHSVV